MTAQRFIARTCLLTILALASSAIAQTGGGEVLGTVRDKSGAIVPQAAITLIGPRAIPEAPMPWK